jgi:hypothetical protein
MQVEIVLTAVGAEPVRASGEMRLLTNGARAMRAGVILLVALVLAAMIIPVPIVHLVGIPLIVMTGLVMAVRQLRSVAVLTPVRMACPRCGAANSFGGGLGLRTATGPIDLTCESCRRPLQLTIVGT